MAPTNRSVFPFLILTTAISAVCAEKYDCPKVLIKILCYLTAGSFNFSLNYVEI